MERLSFVSNQLDSFFRGITSALFAIVFLASLLFPLIAQFLSPQLLLSSEFWLIYDACVLIASTVSAVLFLKTHPPAAQPPQPFTPTPSNKAKVLNNEQQTSHQTFEIHPPKTSPSDPTSPSHSPNRNTNQIRNSALKTHSIPPLILNQFPSCLHPYLTDIPMQEIADGLHETIFKTLRAQKASICILTDKGSVLGLGFRISVAHTQCEEVQLGGEDPLKALHPELIDKTAKKPWTSYFFLQKNNLDQWQAHGDTRDFYIHRNLVKSFDEMVFSLFSAPHPVCTDQDIQLLLETTDQAHLPPLCQWDGLWLALRLLTNKPIQIHERRLSTLLRPDLTQPPIGYWQITRAPPLFPPVPTLF